MGSILCEHCTGACCRYVAVPIDKPRTARDYDDIRWYVMHESILVFVEEGDWYIQFGSKCENLGPDSLCMVYEKRPEICREYEPEGCDYSVGCHGHDLYFTHASQVEKYYEERTGKRLGAPKAPRKRPKKKPVRVGVTGEKARA